MVQLLTFFLRWMEYMVVQHLQVPDCSAWHVESWSMEELHQLRFAMQ